MKYISIIEYLMGRAEMTSLPDELISNMNTLVPKINNLLEAFGEYRACNSGYRTIEDQKRINPSAMKSWHLKCAAIDLEDKDRKLLKWILDTKALEVYDLYMESPDSTPTWVHLQLYPPKSKRRIFIP